MYKPIVLFNVMWVCFPNMNLLTPFSMYYEPAFGEGPLFSMFRKHRRYGITFVVFIFVL